MSGSMKYRLRVGAPDSGDIKRLAAAMRQLQAIGDNRGFAAIAGHHGAPDGLCWHHQFNPHSWVRAQLFLPWHRAYLHKLEQALQDQNDEVSLPWWDWTSEPGIPDSYKVAKIDGSDNPLRRFKMNIAEPNLRVNRFTQRRPGADPRFQLPTAQEIDAALADSDWSSFSDRLQDLHDHVHVWVGGDMASIDTAAYDPVFYAHHSMIDRVWYLWQIEHGLTNIPSQLLDMVLDPFAVTVRDTIDTRALGYEYADSTIVIQPQPAG